MACETKRELERMKLKDCPFCGCEAEFKSYEFGECVCCKSCGASLSNGVYGEEWRKFASADWNSRPIENELEAENKMLIGALKAIKKIVDKPPMSIYDAARIYGECCDALGGKE